MLKDTAARERIEELEKRIEKLEILQQITAYPEDDRPYFFGELPKVFVKDVVGMILSHLNLKPVHFRKQNERFELQEISDLSTNTVDTPAAPVCTCAASKVLHEKSCPTAYTTDPATPCAVCGEEADGPSYCYGHRG